MAETRVTNEPRTIAVMLEFQMEMVRQHLGQVGVDPEYLVVVDCDRFEAIRKLLDPELANKAVAEASQDMEELLGLRKRVVEQAKELTRLRSQVKNLQGELNQEKAEVVKKRSRRRRRGGGDE